MKKPARKKLIASSELATAKGYFTARRRYGKPKPSPTFFKDKIDPKAYSFEEASSWTYQDRLPVQRKSIIPHTERKPHLILKDREGMPRYALCHNRSGDRQILKIESIQQEKTQYAKTEEGLGHSPELEKKASDLFKEDLGMHPAEFLLSEFVHRHREEIKNGVTLRLVLRKKYAEDVIYKALRDRFFDRNPLRFKDGSTEYYAFDLNMKRKRAKQILGI